MSAPPGQQAATGHLSTGNEMSPTGQVANPHSQMPPLGMAQVSEKFDTVLTIRPKTQDGADDAQVIGEKWDTTDDDAAVQQVIQASLKDRPAEAQAEAGPSVQDKPQTPEVRPTIYDRIKDLSERRAVQISPIQNANGDTYIFIDAPEQQPEQDHLDYEAFKQRCARPHVVMSSNLGKLNSRLINRLLEPTAQFRTLRRRNLVGKLPSAIKYVLDLTPPAEGDDRVWLTTQLCCPEGMRLWYLSGHIWKVSAQLVGGQEEFASATISQGSPKGATQNASQSGSSGNRASVVAEYSPVRHHMAIERVLAIAEGLDPLLDSAPKIWSTFAVARYLEIVDSPLRDYFRRWVDATPNDHIIEVLPETCLIMADHLQVEDLTHATFAILVGEEALDNLSDSHTASYSTFGRRKEDLPEILRTRIEYATKNFTDRVIQEAEMLLDEHMSWIETLPEFRKISHTHAEPSALAAQAHLVKSLKEYIRGELCEYLCMEYVELPGFTPPIQGVKLFPKIDRAGIWSTLPPVMRFFTRFFWQSLRDSDLFRGPTNKSRNGVWQTFLLAETRNLPPDTPQFKWPTYERVKKNTLVKAAVAYWKAASKPANIAPPVEPTDVSSAITPLSMPIRQKHPADPAPLRVVHFADQNELTASQVSGHSGSGNQGDDSGREALSHSAESDTGEDTSEEYSPFDSNLLPHQVHQVLDVGKFCGEARDYVRLVAHRLLGKPKSLDKPDHPVSQITNTLACLSDDEYKYLPLWAGGNDDGTNGVFNDDIPMSELGFSTAGPSIHTGISEPSSFGDYDVMDSRSMSDFNTSTATMAGRSNEMHNKRTYAADSVAGSSSGDDFSVIDRSDAIIDDHTAEMLDISDAPSTKSSSSLQEDYDDVFCGFDEDDDEDCEENSDAGSDETMVYAPEDGEGNHK